MVTRNFLKASVDTPMTQNDNSHSLLKRGSKPCLVKRSIQKNSMATLVRALVLPAMSAIRAHCTWRVRFADP